MSKKIQLTIADPCHENWEAMTATERGHFCASCQKHVVDFTSMSDAQLATFFKKAGKDDSVCGRLHSDQLNRDIEIPKKRIPWVRYFFQFALPAFLISMRASAQAKPVKGRLILSTTTVKANQNQHADSLKSRPPMLRPDIKLPAQITDSTDVGASLVSPSIKPSDATRCTHTFTAVLGGISFRPYREKKPSGDCKVIDMKGKKIPFTMIKGQSFEVFSDKKGRFYFPSSARREDSVTIIASAEGYQDKEMVIYKKHGYDDLTIQLSPANAVESREAGLPKVEGTDMEKMDLMQVNVPSVASINLSPNPVQRNNNFNLKFASEKDEQMHLSIVSFTGTIVSERPLKVNRGMNNLAMMVDPRWSAGIYNIQLRNEKGTLVRQEKLIVQ